MIARCKRDRITSQTLLSEELQKQADACDLDNGAGDLRVFDQAFEEAFASDNRCEGVHLYVASSDNKLPAQTPWHFSFDFVPGQASEGWQLRSDDVQIPAVFGKGNVREAAHQICTVVLHKGGSVDM